MPDTPCAAFRQQQQTKLDQMPITIDNKPLEAELASLAAAQAVPTSKRAMTYAILGAATEAFRASGDPLLWSNAAAPPNSSKKSSQLAVDSVRTDQSPAQQGEDIASEVDAGPHSPPASTEPRSDCNPPEARRQAS